MSVYSKTPRESVVGFDKRNSCEIYNSYSSVGLSIIRPNKKEIRLSRIPKNNITVFYPFMKQGEEHDDPQSVVGEYLYQKEQNIKITR